jgi:hypothetical protein
MKSNFINVLAMARDDQRYIFFYQDDTVDEILKQLSDFAKDPELDFDEQDAKVLRDKALFPRDSF